jgi:tetratricopeptide (TPR) repeat protein
MCLGMVADFDDRAGDHGAAIAALDRAVELNATLGLGGFNGSLLSRLGWALLHVGDTSRAEIAYQRALDLARPLDNRPVVFLALSGLAVVRRADDRDGDAVAAAVEALQLHLAGGPRRLANRVDPRADVLTAAAACCAVLGCIAADAARAEQAAELLGQAEHLRAEANVPAPPPFLADDVAGAVDVATALLGRDGFAAAFRRGQDGQLGADLAFEG